MAAARHLAGRGPRRRRPGGHPGRLGRRLHHPGRPVHLTTRSPPAPASTASPTSARWPPTPTSSSPATSTAWSGPWPEAGRRLRGPRPIHHARRAVDPGAGAPGRRGRGGAAGPGRGDRGRRRGQGPRPRVPALRGRGPRLPPGRHHRAPPCEAELCLLRPDPGFTPADPMAPIRAVRSDVDLADALAASRGRPGQTRPMARVLVTEKIADGGLDALRAAGHDVDVQTGLDPEQLLEADRRRPRPHHPLRHPGHRRGARRRHRPGRGGPGRHRPRQRRRRAAPPTRGVMVVNAPQSNILSTAEHTMAMLLAQARNIPQAHAALVAGPLGALQVGGRRAGRQDPRHHRPGPHRQAGGPAGQRLRHADHRPRPVRGPRAGPASSTSSWSTSTSSPPAPTSSPCTWPRPPRPSG